MKNDYPGKICLICEKAPKSLLPDIEKTKYLLKEDINLVQFTQIIRNKLKMEKESALFFLVNGKKSLSGNDTMINIYNKYKDVDGFLYVAYAAEEVWG